MRSFLKLVLILMVFVIQWSCERDEICLEEITPKLIIRFYNENNPNELKSVLGLTVKIEGIEGDYTDETISNFTDSIAIPMPVTENRTNFILTVPTDDQDVSTNTDTLTLVYSQEDIFISRACGYKTVYNDTFASIVQDDDNWMKDLDTKTDRFQVIDENTAHVKIYH